MTLSRTTNHGSMMSSSPQQTIQLGGFGRATASGAGAEINLKPLSVVMVYVGLPGHWIIPFLPLVAELPASQQSELSV
jgi:hypothetical protein